MLMIFFAFYYCVSFLIANLKLDSHRKYCITLFNFSLIPYVEVTYDWTNILPQEPSSLFQQTVGS